MGPGYGDMINNGGLHPLNQSLSGSTSEPLFSGLSPPWMCMPLEVYKGKMYFLAKNSTGSKYLQGKLEGGNLEDVEVIFSELKEFVLDLMVNGSGNLVMQKLFQVCNENQMKQLLVGILNSGGIQFICCNIHGSCCMQKLIELLTPPLKYVVVRSLRPLTCTLLKDSHGRCVIEYCLKKLPPEDIKPLLIEVADNLYEIAADIYGCCFVLRCVRIAQGDIMYQLLDQISANALFLSKHPYGNYVVQNMIAENPYACENLLEQLQGQFVNLSMNTYGSHIVERCLEKLKKDQVMTVILEFTTSGDFLALLLDPFGYGVAETALKVSKDMGQIHEILIDLILGHCHFLHNHPYGKRVLKRAQECKRRLIDP
ncbi:Pumilio RNA-binding repeat [Dillenia turbinata]|uniref:Pumilio RNA-binding repeat n=1 Tax=Dillenia turbinata TaxID=194707 RepID=A0AAN8W4Q4_9MAGN